MVSQGKRLSGRLAKVVVRKTKVWAHQGRSREQRPWWMVRLRITTGGIATLRPGAEGALTKMSHQPTQYQLPEEPTCLAYPWWVCRTEGWLNGDPVTQWKAEHIPLHRMRRYFFQSDPEKRKNSLNVKSLRS